MKLKYKEIKPLREKLLEEQDYKCALCGEQVDIDEAVLDHCHKTGKIRATLHRGCNSLLGKIENNLAINRISKNRLRIILDNTWTYITQEREELIHPTHKPKGLKNDSTKPKRNSNSNARKRIPKV